MITVRPVDAVDAQRHPNTLGQIFALGSLGVIVFFFRRAKAVSLALFGWWICFVAAFLVTAPNTISGSEDVARWATETAVAGLVGSLLGGWFGSTIGEPTASPAFLVGCAVAGPLAGAALIMVFSSLSDMSYRGGWVSPEHVRQGYGPDPTFCAANVVLLRWSVVDLASVVVLFLLTARSARRDATADARDPHTSFTSIP
jgi:hypothetical protein